MFISLEVENNKSKVFLEFLKNLDFVKIEKSELDDNEHTNMLNERIEEYNKNSTQTTDAKIVLEELKLKYGF